MVVRSPAAASVWLRVFLSTTVRLGLGFGIALLRLREARTAVRMWMETTWWTVMKTSERVALEREWRKVYKCMRAAGVDERAAIELLLDPCPTAVAAADIGDAMGHHAEAMTAAGLRSASREEPLQLEAPQPIHARRQRLDAHARLFNHVLALRKRECLGKMNPYIFCTLHDVMMRQRQYETLQYEARGDSAESDDDY